MSIRWIRQRHDDGFIYYEGYDIDQTMTDTRVATIHPSQVKGANPNNKPNKKFVCRYWDHEAFRCRTVKDGKANLETIHASTTR